MEGKTLEKPMVSGVGGLIVFPFHGICFVTLDFLLVCLLHPISPVLEACQAQSGPSIHFLWN